MEKLNKHMTVITKNVGASRPILKCVHYSKEKQNIQATDSHRLLRIKSVKPILSELVMNLENLEMFDGNYPDTDRLIPTSITNKINMYEFNVDNIKKLKKIKAIMKKNPDNIGGKKSVMVSLSFKEDGIYLSTQTEKYFMKLEATKVNSSEAIETTYMNLDYLIDVFDFIKDYIKEFDKEIKDKEISVSWTSPVRPILFKNDFFEYLITPIRAMDNGRF